MAAKTKKEYKLYLLFKGRKRFVFERSFKYRSMAEWEANRLKKDIYLKNVILDYKIV